MPLRQSCGCCQGWLKAGCAAAVLSLHIVYFTYLRHVTVTVVVCCSLLIFFVLLLSLFWSLSLHFISHLIDFTFSFALLYLHFSLLYFTFYLLRFTSLYFYFTLRYLTSLYPTLIYFLLFFHSPPFVTFCHVSFTLLVHCCLRFLRFQNNRLVGWTVNEEKFGGMFLRQNWLFRERMGGKDPFFIFFFAFFSPTNGRIVINSKKPSVEVTFQDSRIKSVSL